MNPMNHEEVCEKLVEYEMGDLSQTEHCHVEAHLKNCSECSKNLNQLEMIREAYRNQLSAKNAESFVWSVMSRIDELEQPKAVEKKGWSLVLPNWLFPTLGYSFAIVLMFMAIVEREPLVTTEAMLISQMPKSSQWMLDEQPGQAENLFMDSKEAM